MATRNCCKFYAPKDTDFMYFEYMNYHIFILYGDL